MNRQMKEMIRYVLWDKGCGKSCKEEYETSMPSWVCHCPGIATNSALQKLSEPCPSGFYGGFIT
jgi:hypothetical protein